MQHRPKNELPEETTEAVQALGDVLTAIHIRLLNQGLDAPDATMLRIRQSHHGGKQKKCNSGYKSGKI